MNRSRRLNLAQLLEPVSGCLAKNHQAQGSLAPLAYYQRQVEKGDRALHKNDLHKNALRNHDPLRNGLPKNDRFIALFHILCGLRPVLSVFTCPNLSPPRILSTIPTNNLSSGQKDPNHQQFYSSRASGGQVHLRAQIRFRVAKHLMQAAVQAVRGRDRTDLHIPLVVLR